jgi:hypothetical protein
VAYQWNLCIDAREPDIGMHIRPRTTVIPLFAALLSVWLFARLVEPESARQDEPNTDRTTQAADADIPVSYCIRESATDPRGVTVQAPCRKERGTVDPEAFDVTATVDSGRVVLTGSKP